MRVVALAVPLLPLLWACTPPAWAGNGLNLVGYGLESVLLAGADATIAGDTAALSTNPAGLAAVHGRRLDLGSGVARELGIGHADAWGNDVDISNPWAVIGSFAYARPWGERGAVGVGLFVQGGAGARYDALDTAFGTRDELTALTGILKLSTGAAWRLDDRWSAGLALSALLARSEQRLFPHTSVIDPADPARSFFGSSFDDATGLRAGLRLGLQGRPRPELAVGLVWSPRTALPLKGDALVVNMTAAGLGPVRYRHLELRGLALPSELAAGLAWQWRPDTRLTLKLARLGWRGALAGIQLLASRPDHPAAPPVIDQRQRLRAHNRLLTALGWRHELDARTSLLAGLNHMRRPLDDAGLSPGFAPIGERHLCFGAIHRNDQGRRIGWGFEYQFPTRVRFTNPQLPFGPDALARSRYLALHLSYGRDW